jgi:7-carboxy-7-deazaguanine synthase (Cx14CxxC type)
VNLLAYSVKEIFYTLQGEGAQSGRPAVFCRFSGCNLWTGLERDRSTAVCRFCDTDFVGTDGHGGGRFASPGDLADAVERTWAGASAGSDERFVVCTGGEPLLQLDRVAVKAMQARGFLVAVETNGTLEAPDGVDWLCVSPKAGAPLRQTSGSEMKLVFPQEGVLPEQFEGLGFAHFFFQPMDGALLR